MPATPGEHSRATAHLAHYLNQSGVTYSLSGSAAGSLIRGFHSVERRDIIIQPDDKFNIQVWPQRPNYNLQNPENTPIAINVNGVPVPIFGVAWQFRDKVVSAYDRQNSREEEIDLNDTMALLPFVDEAVDLTHHPEAVRNILAKCPEHSELLQLKIHCPSVLGDPWIFQEAAGVYLRIEQNCPWYLDDELRRHKLQWDQNNKVYYMITKTGDAFWLNRNNHLVLWTWPQDSAEQNVERTDVRGNSTNRYTRTEHYSMGGNYTITCENGGTISCNHAISYTVSEQGTNIYLP